MKRAKWRLLSLLLVCAMMIGLLPVSALAVDPGVDLKTIDPIYVSVNGDDSADGTREHPLKTLAEAVKETRIPNNTSVVIYVMSNLTMTDSMRYWGNKDITITSDPDSLAEGQTAFTVSRAETGFHAVQDEQQGGYNGAMVEVGNGGDLTLENIVFDDGGFAAYTDPSQPGNGTITGETPYFVQVTSGGHGVTMVGDEAVPNHKIVQDGIITSYSAASTITLGEGAVLQNYGGMSAVRASGATLIMQAGSKICDSKEIIRTKGAEGSLGPEGAVWVQNGTFRLEKGAEISGLNGRAVYADQGQVEVAGTISNLTYNADFQNAFQGVAVHLRGGANGVISGEVKDITLPVGKNINSTISTLHVVDAENSK